MPAYFTAYDTHPFLALAVLRSDGKVFNFKTGGWEALQANGNPTADQMKAVSRPVNVGPLSGNVFATLPELPTEIDGMTAALLQLDAAGNVVAQLDQSPPPYLNYAGGTLKRV